MTISKDYSSNPSAKYFIAGLWIRRDSLNGPKADQDLVVYITDAAAKKNNTNKKDLEKLNK